MNISCRGTFSITASQLFRGSDAQSRCSILSVTGVRSGDTEFGGRSCIFADHDRRMVPQCLSAKQMLEEGPVDVVAAKTQ